MNTATTGLSLMQRFGDRLLRATSLREAEGIAHETVPVLRDVLSQHPEQLDGLLQHSANWKERLGNGLESFTNGVTPPELSGNLALRVACAGLGLGTLDAVLWHLSGRLPLSAQGKGGIASTMTCLLNVSRHSAESLPAIPASQGIAGAVVDSVDPARTPYQFANDCMTAAFHSYIDAFGSAREQLQARGAA